MVFLNEFVGISEKLFEEKYNSSLKTGKNKWFFQKLRF